MTVARETSSTTGHTAPARLRQIWSAIATCCAIVSVLAQPLVFGLAGAVASLIALRRKEPLALLALAASVLGVILGNLIDVMV